VAELLASEVIEQFALGDQLPSEAELALRFAVSRVTVREALKILAGRGLVGLSRGRRAVVTQPDGAMFGGFLRSLIKSDPRAKFDLLQVRRTLEVQAVALACRNASRAGFAAVEAALEAMRAAALDSETAPGDAGVEMAFVAADVRFHQAVALAGGNRVLTYLFEAMETSLREAFLASQRGQRRSGTSLLEGYEAHRGIYEHIRARDERAAGEAMIALLTQAEQHLRWAMDNPPQPGEGT
jgi:DNA-binding FadR family transcriptional regulator